MVEKPTYEELRNRVEHLEQMINEHNGINTRHEESLSQLIQAMAIPTFIINEAHLITHWNKACEKFTGVPSAEMIGTPDAWKAFYPEKRPVLADLVVDCSSHKQINEYYDHFSRYELVDDAFQAQAFFPRLGDTGKWLYFTATPLMDHSKKAIGAIETFQDITRPKRLEEHSRLILEAIPDSVVVYDIQHRITYINEAFEETYGWTKNDLIGGKIDFVPSEEIENTKEAWQRTLGGEKVFFETKRKTKNGSLLDIQLRTAILKDKDGNHSASIVIHRDVTVIKQTEKALRESEEKYRFLVETANEAIFIAQDNIIKFPNPKTLELTGYSEEELANIPLADLIYPEDRQMVVERYRQRLNGESPPSDYSFRIINKANSVLWVQINATKTTWDGRPATINLLRDISEKRQLEEQLRQAQKMEAIGNLTGGIAHDYNNLMSIIMGNLSMAQEKAESGSDLADFLNEADMASRKVRDLTHELMSLSRGGRPVREVGSLGELLKNVSELIPADSGISLTESISQDLKLVAHDRLKMSAVIRNVVKNAVEAMPGGGTLKIKAENLRVEDAKQDSCLILKPGDFVHISIQDQGNGIPEEDMGKIFDPYFSSKERGVQKGMGLGLTTAYAIVQKHGGHIQIDSSLGAGTTVNIYLPAESGPEQMDSTITSTDKKTSSVQRVLVMDDEEMLRKLARQMLERMGYVVETVEDGLEAIEKYKKQKDSSEPFDAVILDLTIKGGMGGEQTIQELLKIDPDVKAIVSSGYFNDPVMSDFEKYGFMGSLAKPYEKKALKEVLERLSE